MKKYMIDIITAFISSLTSFITIFITIRNTNRNQKKVTELQNKQFYQSLVEQQKIFELNKKQEDLRNAISMMPYFKMLEGIRITNRTINNDLIVLDFKFSILNIGNGTAINVSIVSKIEDHQCIVCEEEYPSSIKYIYTDPLSCNIIRSNESTLFGICCNYHDRPAKVFLKIRFQDMMLRNYEQNFSFYYMYGRFDNEAYRIDSYMPTNIVDN